MFLQFASVGHISRNASRQTITATLSSWKKKHSSHVSYGSQPSHTARHNTNWRPSAREHENCHYLPTLWCNPWEKPLILDSNVKSWVCQVVHHPIIIPALVCNILAFVGHNGQSCDLSDLVFLIVSFTNSHHRIYQLTRSWICRSTITNEFGTRTFIKVIKNHTACLTHNFQTKPFVEIEVSNEIERNPNHDIVHKFISHWKEPIRRAWPKIAHYIENTTLIFSRKYDGESHQWFVLGQRRLTMWEGRRDREMLRITV
jgi:hypothetical protein